MKRVRNADLVTNLSPTPYALWMFRVRWAMRAIASVTEEDIDDWGYYDAYDAGMNPITAAREALKAAGFPAEAL